MMSPTSKMGEEQKLQQRWEFRRRDNDSDSSCDHSKSTSSHKQALKRHKLVSSLVSVSNDETSNTSRKCNYNPGVSGQTKFGKAEKGKRARSKKDDLARNEMKKVCQKEVSRKKKKTSTFEYGALDDLKIYMNSLLGDLKVSRENLLKWMREQVERLAAEGTASDTEKREGGLKGEKVKLRHQNHSEENEQVQSQNFGKNVQVQHQLNFVEYGQVQHQSKFEENIHIERVMNFEESIEVNHRKNFQENIQQRQQNIFGACTGAPNSSCNGGPTEMFGKSNKSGDSKNCSLAFEDQVDHGRAFVPVTPTGKDREERLALSTKLNPKSSPSDQNVNVQQQKSIVLGKRAQNCIGGSSERSAKGNKTTDSNDHCHVHKDCIDYAQAIGSMVSIDKGKGETSGSSADPIFASDSYGQLASSMYLTLPTVLSEQYVANHRFDNSSFNCIQPRDTGNQTGMNSERSKLALGSSSPYGYFPNMQTEERSRNFSRVPEKSVTSTKTAARLHQPVNTSVSNPSLAGLENLTCEYNNSLGQIINGGAIRLLGRNYPFPEQSIQSIGNNFYSHSNYKRDGRLMPFQDGYQFPKSFMGGE